jgi:hypothetical protein
VHNVIAVKPTKESQDIVIVTTNADACRGFLFGVVHFDGAIPRETSTPCHHMVRLERP